MMNANQAYYHSSPVHGDVNIFRARRRGGISFAQDSMEATLVAETAEEASRELVLINSTAGQDVEAEAGAKVLQMMSEWSLNEAPIRSRTGIRQVQ